MKKIRVLVVDDSALVRTALVEALRVAPDIEVAGTAEDPFAAARFIASEVPDVMLLDIEMPRMDGITFLRKVMAQHPIATVICSTLAERGSAAAMAALAAGAVELIQKPKVGSDAFFKSTASQLHQIVRAAAVARVGATAALRPHRGIDSTIPATQRRAPVGRLARRRVVALGASTGGTEALGVVLRAAPPDLPGVVIVQHMPENFTKPFAQWLDSQSVLSVSEAVDGDEVVPGRALVAPGGRHMVVIGSPGAMRVKLLDGEKVNRHKPSVDALFDSVASRAGHDAVAALLTGMGDDGARGMVALRAAGAHTVAQDEATSVVFGMPAEAIRLGGANEIRPLQTVMQALEAAVFGKAPVTGG